METSCGFDSHLPYFRSFQWLVVRKTSRESGWFFCCGSIVERIEVAINGQTSRPPLDKRPVGRWTNVPLGRIFVRLAYG